MDSTPPAGPEQTRQQIITAAHRLFISQGFHGTSMRQIARQAGTALGGIYNHFSGKEDVFRAVLFAYHPYKEVVPALLHAEGDSLEEFMRAAVGRMMAALDRRPDFLNLMFIEIVEFNSRHVQELFASIWPDVTRIAARIYSFADPLRDIPLPVLLRAFLGLFFSYYMTEKMLVSNAHNGWSENTIDYFVDIFLHGVLADPSGAVAEQAQAQDGKEQGS